MWLDVAKARTASEAVPDLADQRWRRNRETLLGQELHDLTTDLQVRDVPVEIDPVQALHIERDVPGEDVVDGQQPSTHGTPPRPTWPSFTPLDPSAPQVTGRTRPPTSAVRGEASLGHGRVTHRDVPPNARDQGSGSGPMTSRKPSSSSSTVDP